jgi:probable phosphoglycerate mutase
MATPAATEGAPPIKRPRKAISASARDAVTDATATPGQAARAGRAGRAGRKPKPTPVPATLIFFVRHGTTPTTGQVLPGRAPGLHLADSGKAEAEAVAERLAALTIPASPATAAHGKPTNDKASNATAANGKATNGKATNSKATNERATDGRAPTQATLSVAAVYASPLERARETAAPIGKRLGHKVAIEKGLIEMDFGEWTGAELKALRKLPEWNAVQRYPSGFQFPGGEAFSAMRARIAATVAMLCLRHPGEAIVAVSHADVIKAAVSDALGTHLDLFQRIVVSTCSVTAISYSPSGPVVLAVNSTGGLGALRPS